MKSVTDIFDRMGQLSNCSLTNTVKDEYSESSVLESFFISLFKDDDDEEEDEVEEEEETEIDVGNLCFITCE